MDRDRGSWDGCTRFKVSGALNDHPGLGGGVLGGGDAGEAEGVADDAVDGALLLAVTPAVADLAAGLHHGGKAVADLNRGPETYAISLWGEDLAINGDVIKAAGDADDAFGQGPLVLVGEVGDSRLHGDLSLI